ncbi:glycosyltransferase family 4 protein [Mesoaciditoga lauensis]|uniref:glycosyltransferase family 4 protein n=1 Tax=Mesoaciditoga lauensis TaxID=1495039 RepID=UPI00055A4F66|nr:glycosyltransferase family 4 protein [Mesoaciditoga lauensis]
MQKNKIVVHDVFNTDYGAYRLLRTRVHKIDSDSEFENWIICPDGKYSKKMKKTGIKIINTHIDDKSINPITDRSSISELANIFKKLKPDIVHTHTSKGGYIGRIAAKRAGVPHVIHQVHGFHFTQLNGIKKKIYEHAEKYLSKYAEVILFQNMNEFKLAQNMGFGSRTKLLYVGNGIPMEEFEGAQVKSAPKRGEKFKIVCVARLEPVKNHEMLFKAAQILKKENLNFEILLVGDGNLKNEYIEMCKKMGIKENIKFVGNVDREEVRNILTSSHISVLTSLKEGKPRSLMESQIVGLPVVATNVVGTDEIILNGENGFLVEVDDAKSLADKIKLLYEDENLWMKMSQSAKRIAKKNFDENVIVERLKKLYISLINDSLEKFLEETNKGKVWFEGVK